MPETRACPIWQIWMRDYKAAIGRARQEWRENDELFRTNGRR
jgi:hypothetical protein